MARLDIKFRRLTPADEPFLWDMLYLAVYVPEGSPLPPRDIIHNPDLARYVDGWGRPGDDGFAALDGDKPIGAVWIRLLNGKNKGYGYVDDETPELSIAVLPEYRGMGIGRTLMRHILESTLPKYWGISLSVSRENPAVQLYESCGFKTVADDPTTLIMAVRG